MVVCRAGPQQNTDDSRLGLAMINATILIADSDPAVRSSLAAHLQCSGCDVLEAGTAAAVLERMTPGVDIVLLDSALPGAEAMTTLAGIRHAATEALVILMVPSASAEAVREARVNGAFHVLSTPLDVDRLAAAMALALEMIRLRREVRLLREHAARSYTVQALVGTSSPMSALRHRVGRIATNATSSVLLSGECGTGKDLVGRIIHYTSQRAARPLVRLDCCGLTERQFERQLYGHESGASNGSDTRKRGLLEIADGGTVMLSRVCALAPAQQAKLSQFLKNRSFRRAGGSEDIHADVRIVAGTTLDLEASVVTGRFRDDLFHRLNGLPIAIPPLRTCAADVPLLLQYFIDTFNTELGKRVIGATTAACEALQSYGWPGNVRELRNVVERAMLLTNEGRLDSNLLAAIADATGMSDALELPARGVDLEKLERSLVIQALRRCAGNQTRAALLLGLNRDQVRYRVEKFGLTLS